MDGDGECKNHKCQIMLVLLVMFQKSGLVAYPIIFSGFYTLSGRDFWTINTQPISLPPFLKILLSVHRIHVIALQVSN